MRVSVIVPAYNCRHEVGECLAALLASEVPPDEIVVVDDGSVDDTAAVAAEKGARVVRLPANAGPAAARNRGVAAATGDVLLFVDADVVVSPGAVGRAARTLGAHPELAAVFGSYDAQPRAAGLVSQYRNLLHHYVHQHGAPEASTFWAGCGAVRREAFAAVRGFDERPVRRFIEDIELGHRLRLAGYRIRLDPALQGTHLKRWTLTSMVRTDFRYRAVPWARLIAEGAPGKDLNLAAGQRLSVALLGLAGLALPLTPMGGLPILLGLASVLGIAALNRRLYRFFWQVRGPGFALVAFPLHLLYFACSGLGYLYGRVTPPRLSHRSQAADRKA